MPEVIPGGEALGATVQGLDLARPLADAEVDAVLRALGAVTIADSPSEYAAFLRKDHERWAGVIRVSGVKPQ